MLDKSSVKIRRKKLLQYDVLQGDVIDARVVSVA